MIYRFHPAAEAEHYETIQYYESRSASLGGDYLVEFERLMSRVLEAPHRFRVERQPDIRRASLIRFPYQILYRETNDLIQVLAVSHRRRRPNYWVGRI